MTGFSSNFRLAGVPDRRRNIGLQRFSRGAGFGKEVYTRACSSGGLMEEKIRMFLAIDLPPEVRSWLGKAQSLLAGRIPEGTVRWVKVEGVHITLKFLGETPARRIDEIRVVMDDLASGHRPFPLIVEGLGCFPNPARPRVLWAGVRREPALAELQKRLEEGLERIGFRREERAFSPHLTLGRVRDGVGGGKLGEIGRVLETATPPEAVAMQADGWCLFKSVLRPGGAEYSVLHWAKFSG
jgi:2'-5' RNA ligase